MARPRVNIAKCVSCVAGEQRFDEHRYKDKRKKKKRWYCRKSRQWCVLVAPSCKGLENG